jgi:hypothetical protein
MPPLFATPTFGADVLVELVHLLALAGAVLLPPAAMYLLVFLFLRVGTGDRRGQGELAADQRQEPTRAG